MAKQNFGYIDPSSQSISLSNDYSARYSAEIIAYAEQLKGMHENDTINAKDSHGNTVTKKGSEVYTDIYYLEYARKYFILNNKKAWAGIIEKFGFNSDQPRNIEWSKYSYEEIIQMENAGFSIPQEIIEWAHGQQETDIMSYVVIADEANVESQDNTTEIASNSDPNEIAKIAKSYLVKVDKASSVAEKAVEKVRDNKNSIEALNSKKSLLKKLFNNEEKLYRKWKALDDKYQANNISASELLQYKKLTKQLKNGQNERFDSEQDVQLLDNFLDSIDAAKKESQNVNNISQEATVAGIDRSEYDKTFSSMAQTGKNANIASLNNNNISFDEVASELSKEITNLEDTEEELALDKEEVQEEFPEIISEDGEINNNVEAQDPQTSETAQDPTETVDEGAKADTKAEIDKQEEVKSRKTENKNTGLAVTSSLAAMDPGINPDSMYGFFLPRLTEPTTALAMTLLTAAYRHSLENHDKDVKTDSKILRKSSSIVEKVIKKLEKDTAQKEKQVDTDSAKEEKITQQIQEIQTTSKQEEEQAIQTVQEEAMQAQAETVQPTENSEVGISEVTEPKEPETQPVKANVLQDVPVETSSAEETDKLTGELEALSNDKKSLVKDIRKSIITAKKQEKLTTSIVNKLHPKNTDFTAEAKALKEKGVLTSFCGAYALSIGAGNLASSIILTSVASGLMSNPISAAFGARLMLKSLKWFGISAAQLIVGAITASEGRKSIESADSALAQSKETETSIKSGEASAQNANKSLDGVTKTVAQLEKAETGSQNSQAQPETSSNVTPVEAPAQTTSPENAETQEPSQIIIPEQPEDINASEEENEEPTIAASASVNVSAAKGADTTDKSERKLTRFNNDSIIESRKKQKKVLKVSAASGGNVKK